MIFKLADTAKIYKILKDHGYRYRSNHFFLSGVNSLNCDYHKPESLFCDSYIDILRKPLDLKLARSGIYNITHLDGTKYILSRDVIEIRFLFKCNCVVFINSLEYTPNKFHGEDDDKRIVFIKAGRISLDSFRHADVKTIAYAVLKTTSRDESLCAYRTGDLEAEGYIWTPWR